MPSVNWQCITNELAENRTSWINALSKENLIEVCKHYQIAANDTWIVKQLRKALSKCVKAIITDRK